MTFGMLENGLHTADFLCCENVEMEPFSGKCKVQMMRDGNVYVTELPRQQRNKPLFREDNSSLSHTRDGRYYFVFALEESREEELPVALTTQALTIARKFQQRLLNEE